MAAADGANNIVRHTLALEEDDEERKKLVNQPDDLGRTALYHAAAADQDETCKLLVELKADASARATLEPKIEQLAGEAVSSLQATEFEVSDEHIPSADRQRVFSNYDNSTAEFRKGIIDKGDFLIGLPDAGVKTGHGWWMFELEVKRLWRRLDAGDDKSSNFTVGWARAHANGDGASVPELAIGLRSDGVLCCDGKPMDDNGEPLDWASREDYCAEAALFFESEKAGVVGVPAKYDNSTDGLGFVNGPVGFVDGRVLNPNDVDIGGDLRAIPSDYFCQNFTPWVRDRQKESTTIRVFNA